jgi:NAD(P)-dependent dehydrogenase (short-subunit alcohol dehydrogenase family)
VRGRLTVIVLSLALAGASVAAVPATASAKNWTAGCKAAIDYISHRAGNPTFALKTGKQWCTYRPWHTEPSASVIKAMILVAYLRRDDVRNRGLSSGEQDTLAAMIERSDDSAANYIFYNYVGYGGLDNLASAAGMNHFQTHPDPRPGCCEYWGRTSIAAGDQANFFLHLGHFIPQKHVSYALQLLSSIDPGYGYWGIADVNTPGWTKYWKSGWGAGTGWVDSQSILLRRGGMKIGLSILTHNDPDHTYGKNTLRGVAGRLLKGLNRHAKVR